jgi:CubicO group peptidase (beta-lactamase class C family)
MRTTNAWLIRVLAAGFVAVPVVGVAIVGVASGPAWSAPAPASCADPTTAAVSEFFDSSLRGPLEQNHVPGAVVSVVAGGKTVFAKGYGMADVEHGVPFDASRSLVRIASITKLFTFTAVMQQVEAGKLDLDADVNTYLKTFKVPATYPKPITLLTLMNHTSGFEDRFLGAAARTADDVPPLGDFLAANMPARIRPPGEVSGYSNYGAALAGYIVSQVSGEPYDQYVQHHILDPLRMTHSTATEPVPATLAGDLARSYDTDASPPVRKPFMFDRMAPDGSVSATAADMANFMVAHLHEGRFDDASILGPATMAQMHESSFAEDPRLAGYAHGFRQQTMNGHEVLMHDGGWEGFLSALFLVPGCDLGLFVSSNGTGAGKPLGDVLQKFFDRFVPTPATADVVKSAAGTTQAKSVPPAGFYEPTRHNESTVEKLTNLLGPARLTVASDGTLHFGGKEWHRQGDGFYVRADGKDHLVSFVGTDGTRYIATDATAFQLMHDSETLPVNLVVLLVFAIPALSALLLPVVALIRRLRHRPREMSRRWRAARWLAGGAALVGIVFAVALFNVLVTGGDEFLYGAPASFRLLLVLPILVLLAFAGSVAYTVVGWRGSGAGVVARIHQVTIVVGLSALTWFLWQWNLIGWQF